MPRRQADELIVPVHAIFLHLFLDSLINNSEIHFLCATYCKVSNYCYKQTFASFLIAYGKYLVELWTRIGKTNLRPEMLSYSWHLALIKTFTVWKCKLWAFWWAAPASYDYSFKLISPSLELVVPRCFAEFGTEYNKKLEFCIQHKLFSCAFVAQSDFRAKWIDEWL